MNNTKARVEQRKQQGQRNEQFQPEPYRTCPSERRKNGRDKNNRKEERNSCKQYWPEANCGDSGLLRVGLTQALEIQVIRLQMLHLDFP